MYISARQIISKVYSDVGEWSEPNHHLIIGWVAEVMSDIATKGSLERCVHTIHVKDHKAFLPCDAFGKPIAVVHDGCRIRKSNMFHINMGSYTRNDNKSDEHQTFEADIVIKTFYDQEGNLKTVYDADRRIPIRFSEYKISAEYYTQEDDVLHFSFETGVVDVYYQRIKTDASGFPMVTGDYDSIEACYYYVLSKMIARGFNHPIFKGLQGFNQLKTYYTDHKTRAKTFHNRLSIDELESMRQKLCQLMPNSSAWVNMDKHNETELPRITNTKNNLI
jgi:hypothetical protein